MSNGDEIKRTGPQPPEPPPADDDPAAGEDVSESAGGVIDPGDGGDRYVAPSPGDATRQVAAPSRTTSSGEKIVRCVYGGRVEEDHPRAPFDWYTVQFHHPVRIERGKVRLTPDQEGLLLEFARPLLTGEEPKLGQNIGVSAVDTSVEATTDRVMVFVKIISEARIEIEDTATEFQKALSRWRVTPAGVEEALERARATFQGSLTEKEALNLAEFTAHTLTQASADARQSYRPVFQKFALIYRAALFQHGPAFVERLIEAIGEGTIPQNVQKDFFYLFYSPLITLLDQFPYIVIPHFYRLADSGKFDAARKIMGGIIQRAIDRLSVQSGGHWGSSLTCQASPTERNSEIYEMIVSGVLPRIQTGGRPLVIHNIGDSTGTGTTELLNYFRHQEREITVVSSNLVRDVYFVTKEDKTAIYGSRGQLLSFRIGDRIFPGTSEQHRHIEDLTTAVSSVNLSEVKSVMAVNGCMITPYHLADPDLLQRARTDPDSVRLGEADMRDSASQSRILPGGKAHVVLLLNVITKKRFPEKKIRYQAVQQMGATLYDGGFLVVGRAFDYPPYARGVVSVYQRLGDELVWVGKVQLPSLYTIDRSVRFFERIRLPHEDGDDRDVSANPWEGIEAYEKENQPPRSTEGVGKADKTSGPPTEDEQTLPSLTPVRPGEIELTNGYVPAKDPRFAPKAVRLLDGEGREHIVIIERRPQDEARELLRKQNYPDREYYERDIGEPNKREFIKRAVFLARGLNGEILGYSVYGYLNENDPGTLQAIRKHKRDFKDPKKYVKGLGWAMSTYIFEGWKSSWENLSPYAPVTNYVEAELLHKFRKKSHGGRQSPVPTFDDLDREWPGMHPGTWIPVVEAKFICDLFRWAEIPESLVPTVPVRTDNGTLRVDEEAPQSGTADVPTRSVGTSGESMGTSTEPTPPPPFALRRELLKAISASKTIDELIAALMSNPALAIDGDLTAGQIAAAIERFRSRGGYDILSLPKGVQQKVRDIVESSVIPASEPESPGAPGDPSVRWDDTPRRNNTSLVLKLLRERDELYRRIADLGTVASKTNPQRKYSPEELKDLLDGVLDGELPVELLPNTVEVRGAALKYMRRFIRTVSGLYNEDWHRMTGYPPYKNRLTGEYVPLLTRGRATQPKYRAARTLLNAKMDQPLFGRPTRLEEATIIRFVSEKLGVTPQSYAEAQTILRQNLENLSDPFQTALLNADPLTRFLVIEAFFGPYSVRVVHDPIQALRLADFIGKINNSEGLWVTLFYSGHDVQATIQKKGLFSPYNKRPTDLTLMEVEPGRFIDEGMRIKADESRHVLFSVYDLSYAAYQAIEVFETCSENEVGFPPTYNPFARVLTVWRVHPLGMSEMSIQLNDKGKAESVKIRYSIRPEAGDVDPSHIKEAKFLRKEGRRYARAPVFVEQVAFDQLFRSAPFSLAPLNERDGVNTFRSIAKIDVNEPISEEVLDYKMHMIHGALEQLPKGYSPLKPEFNPEQACQSQLVCDFYLAIFGTLQKTLIQFPKYLGIKLLAYRLVQAFPDDLRTDDEQLMGLISEVRKQTRNAVAYRPLFDSYELPWGGTRLVPTQSVGTSGESVGTSGESVGTRSISINPDRLNDPRYRKRLARDLFLLSVGYPLVAHQILVDLYRLIRGYKTRPAALSLTMDVMDESYEHDKDFALSGANYSLLMGTVEPIAIFKGPTIAVPWIWSGELYRGVLSQDLEDAVVADVGTGSAILAIALAKERAVRKVIVTDKNPDYAMVAFINAWLNSTDDSGQRLEGVQPIDLIEFLPEGNLLETFSEEGTADVIMANVPVFPSDDTLSDRDLGSYYAPHGFPENRYGLENLARLLDQAKGRLSDTGIVVMCVPGWVGLTAMDEMAERRGYVPEIVETRRMQWLGGHSLAYFAEMERTKSTGDFWFYHGDRRISATAANDIAKKYLEQYHFAPTPEDRERVDQDPAFKIEYDLQIVSFRPLEQYRPQWRSVKPPGLLDLVPTQSVGTRDQAVRLVDGDEALTVVVERRSLEEAREILDSQHYPDDYRRAFEFFDPDMLGNVVLVRSLEGEVLGYLLIEVRDQPNHDILAFKRSHFKHVIKPLVPTVPVGTDEGTLRVRGKAPQSGTPDVPTQSVGTRSRKWVQPLRLLTWAYALNAFRKNWEGKKDTDSVADQIQYGQLKQFRLTEFTAVIPAKNLVPTQSMGTRTSPIPPDIYRHPTRSPHDYLRKAEAELLISLFDWRELTPLESDPSLRGKLEGILEELKTVIPAEAGTSRDATGDSGVRRNDTQRQDGSHQHRDDTPRPHDITQLQDLVESLTNAFPAELDPFNPESQFNKVAHEPLIEETVGRALEALRLIWGHLSPKKETRLLARHLVLNHQLEHVASRILGSPFSLSESHPLWPPKLVQPDLARYIKSADGKIGVVSVETSIAGNYSDPDYRVTLFFSHKDRPQRAIGIFSIRYKKDPLSPGKFINDTSRIDLFGVEGKAYGFELAQRLVRYHYAHDSITRMNFQAVEAGRHAWRHFDSRLSDKSLEKVRALLRDWNLRFGLGLTEEAIMGATTPYRLCNLTRLESVPAELLEIALSLVPTVPVGTDEGTLRVRGKAPQSGSSGVPTQSVGTRTLGWSTERVGEMARFVGELALLCATDDEGRSLYECEINLDPKGLDYLTFIESAILYWQSRTSRIPRAEAILDSLTTERDVLLEGRQFALRRRGTTAVPGESGALPDFLDVVQLSRVVRSRDGRATIANIRKDPDVKPTDGGYLIIWDIIKDGVKIGVMDAEYKPDPSNPGSFINTSSFTELYEGQGDSYGFELCVQLMRYQYQNPRVSSLEFYAMSTGPYVWRHLDGLKIDPKDLAQIRVVLRNYNIRFHLGLSNREIDEADTPYKVCHLIELSEPIEGLMDEARAAYKESGWGDEQIRSRTRFPGEIALLNVQRSGKPSFNASLDLSPGNSQYLAFLNSVIKYWDNRKSKIERSQAIIDDLKLELERLKALQARDLLSESERPPTPWPRPTSSAIPTAGVVEPIRPGLPMPMAPTDVDGGSRGPGEQAYSGMLIGGGVHMVSTHAGSELRIGHISPMGPMVYGAHALAVAKQAILVPMVPVGTDEGTLRVRGEAPQSGSSGVPTQSVGTRDQSVGTRKRSVGTRKGEGGRSIADFRTAQWEARLAGHELEPQFRWALANGETLDDFRRLGMEAEAEEIQVQRLLDSGITESEQDEIRIFAGVNRRFKRGQGSIAKETVRMGLVRTRTRGRQAGREMRNRALGSVLRHQRAPMRMMTRVF